MNVADTFAFTIDIEFVDITNDKQKHSDQYEKRKKKAQNEMRKQEYQISNTSRNAFYPWACEWV